MEIYIEQGQSPAIVNDAARSSITAYVGIGILIYVLLLFVLAPRQHSLTRRKSLL